MIHLTIDDHVIAIPSGYTVLQAAREHGILIPTLCYLESLPPYAACRVMDATDGQRINGCAHSIRLSVGHPLPLYLRAGHVALDD